MASENCQKNCKLHLKYRVGDDEMNYRVGENETVPPNLDFVEGGIIHLFWDHQHEENLGIAGRLKHRRNSEAWKEGRRIEDWKWTKEIMIYGRGNAG